MTPRLDLDASEIGFAEADPPLPDPGVESEPEAFDRWDSRQPASFGGDARTHRRDRTPTLLDDVALLDRPEPAYLVDKLVGEQAQILVAGAPGTGKTTLIAALAVAVATPRPFQGRRVRQRGNVICCALEGERTHAARIRSAKVQASIPIDRVVGIYTWIDPLLLAEPDDVSALIGATQHLDPVLMTIDTYARANVGLDENSATDAGRVVAGLDRIRRELGCAVVITHHLDKRNQAERGSGALRGAVDGVWLLAEADDIITLSCSKSRDSEPFSPIDLRRERTADGGVVLRAAIDVTPTGEVSPKQRQILEALSTMFSGDGATVGELLAALPSIPQPSLYRALKSLVDAGRLRHAARHYQIVPGGEL